MVSRKMWNGRQRGEVNVLAGLGSVAAGEGWGEGMWRSCTICCIDWRLTLFLSGASGLVVLQGRVKWGV